MKLSALFLTVNIAAGLPIILLGPALAADAAHSSDLASGVKMRAFIPGRKLPSKKDLVQSSLQIQQPTMAQEQAGLNGQVTETIRQNLPPVTPYAEGTPYANVGLAPQMMPSQMQAVARQVKQQIKKHAPSAESKLEQMRASLDAQQKVNDANAQTGPSQAAPGWMANTKNLQVVAPEVKSPEEQAEISRMVQQINPQTFEEQQAPQRTGTAGPPPFPLNLLPEQSLKQLLGAKGAPPAGAAATASAPRVSPPRKISAPPAFFGSWHGSMPSAKAAPATHLASSGFQTHMRSKGFAAPMRVSPKKAANIAAKPQSKSANKALIAQAPRKPELKISLYAPYSTATR